jgi:hypothetical protein
MKPHRDIEVRLDQRCLDWVSSLPKGETKDKVERMLDTLKEKVDAGDYVPRSLWPKDTAYLGIRNLFRYEIDRSMRASYTLRRDGDKYTVRVIEIFPDHKSYERRFRY